MCGRFVGGLEHAVARMMCGRFVGGLEHASGCHRRPVKPGSECDLPSNSWYEFLLKIPKSAASHFFSAGSLQQQTQQQ
jgi:hypothetical protein